jgi:DNA-binding transcriptional LysR family regulator
LQTGDGPLKLDLSGPYDTDDGEVLVDWALQGHGIINRERFLIAGPLASGDLVEVLPDTPPLPSDLAIVYPHKRLLDPKMRVFMDFMIEHCLAQVRAIEAEPAG